MKRFLSAFLSLFLFFSVTSLASASERCTVRSNLDISPDKPLNVVASSWLNWLDRSYQFTCSGNASRIACIHGVEEYDFTYSCNGSNCTVTTWQGQTPTFQATLPAGNASSWNWYAPNRGYILPNCILTGLFQGPCYPVYRSCFKDLQ